MQTIRITGCSSGFGLDTGQFFLERGWNVIATMRTPRADILPRSPNLRVLALDVTDPDSIRQAVQAAGPIGHLERINKKSALRRQDGNALCIWLS